MDQGLVELVLPGGVPKILKLAELVTGSSVGKWDSVCPRRTGKGRLRFLAVFGGVTGPKRGAIESDARPHP